MVDGGRNVILDAAAPENAEAEQGLLGAIMAENRVMDRDAVAMLEPEHFGYPLHRQIFHIMRSLRERGMLIEPATLLEYLRGDILLSQAGGPAYLARMVAAAELFYAEGYASTIREAAFRRRLVEAAHAIIERAQRPAAADTVSEMAADAEALISAVSQDAVIGNTMVPLSAALDEAMQQAEAAYKADGRIIGVPTGLDDLDRALGGLHKANLVILAGRPAMGKTAMAVGFARAAASAGRSVAFFSLEMSHAELALRMIAEDTGISVERVRSARIGHNDIVAMLAVRNELAALPLHIDDDGSSSIAYIRLRCRQIHRSRPLGLIVVDYLQLIHARQRGGDQNRVNEVSEITRALKMMSKEFDCPVLALSQLSRRCEERDDKRPLLSDLRESGSIEQDANVVLFVYRQEVYTEREKPKENEKDSKEGLADKLARWNDRMARDAGLAECIIAKNRNGATRTVHLHFDGPRMRFANLARDDQ
jgi:replicative DNA helicase